MFQILISFVFIVGYIMIALEHKWNLHKAITAASLGGFLWFLIALKERGSFLKENTAEIGSEIFGLILFLLAAMTLVEVMAHYRFFDYVKSKIVNLGFDEVKQFWVIVFMGFFLSAIIDNLTTTIVMIEIVRGFFKGRNMLLASIAVVVAANSGGAWSPIGDVTTIMLWLADKFTALQLIYTGFVPAVVMCIVSCYFLSRKIIIENIKHENCDFKLKKSEIFVIVTCLFSFILPIAFSYFNLEPYFGLLFGLGIVGFVIAIFRTNLKMADRKRNCDDNEDSPAGLETHMTVDFEKKIARVDLASLLFFAGILLAVGALEHVGVLHYVADLFLGTDPSLYSLIIGSGLLGLLSAIVDNIPITSAAMSMISTTDFSIWVLLALTVGTGGSILVIGSAAGVVAMGRIKELTFGKYFSLGAGPISIGYFVAIAVWCIQHMLI